MGAADQHYVIVERQVGIGERGVGVALDYETSASSIMEYLLTDHPYRREIAQLSNREIERLRGMLHEAIEQRFTPQAIYDAITRGFDQALGESVSSPPLANDLREGDANTEMELMEALLREISPA
jgi:hypothetical protein